MVRVFAIDVLECPRCKSRMQLISFVQDPKATHDILRALKISTAPPPEFCDPNDRIVENDNDQACYTDEEAPPSTYF